MAVPTCLGIAIGVTGISIHVVTRPTHFQTVPRIPFSRSAIGNHNRCFAIEQEEEQYHPGEDGAEHPKDAGLWLPLLSDTCEGRNSRLRRDR